MQGAILIEENKYFFVNFLGSLLKSDLLYTYRIDCGQGEQVAAELRKAAEEMTEVPEFFENIELPEQA